MSKMKPLDHLAFLLLILGGINWGFDAIGHNLAEMLISFVWLQKTIYIIIGISAIYAIYTYVKLNLIK